MRVLFLAPVPAVGFAVFDVQTAQTPTVQTEMRVTDRSLENARYRVQIDANGDIASLFDKRLRRELLRAPIRLALQTERPVDWPAWNMDWADRQKPPRAYVAGPAAIRVVERGPVRVAIEVTREAEDSRFVQTIRLAAGDAGNRLELANVIDWKIEAAALKATFPLTAANTDATYNWDIGTIQRSNNEPTKFEVPSHQWFDLTDRSGEFGVTVLSDCKYASDKPDDSTLRLTLIYTPGIGTGNGRDYADQSTQDWGHHEFVYGLAGHAGDWRREQTDWQAQRLNQPLVAYLGRAHHGPLGRSFSLMSVSSSRVRVLALKKAQQGDEYVVRLVELDGRPAPGVRVRFASPIVAAREINGAEEPVGPATVVDGALVADLGRYEPRTYAVKLAAPARALVAPRSQAVPLPYDTSVSRRDGTAGSGSAFDAAGRSLAAEMLPSDLRFAGARFVLAAAGSGSPDALTARGQSIALPPGPFTRVYVLAASAQGERRVAFHIGQQSFEASVQDWGGYIGQWDNRTWNVREEVVEPRPGEAPLAPDSLPRTRTVMEYTGLVPGYLKPLPVAWFASHRHAPDGTNEPYEYSYLFAYAFDVAPGATTLTLPNDDKVRVLAVTVTDEGPGLTAVDLDSTARLP
jgi:alpha-mannosidase